MPNSNEIIYVDIDKLDNDLWDSRSYINKQRRQKIEDEVNKLAENIQNEDLHTPIIIALPKPNGHYSIVDGRLRTKAHRKLGLKNIKCIFTAETDKSKLADITYTQNYQRENLTLDDQLYRLRNIFEQNGYTLKQALDFSKSLHNSSTIGKPSKTVPDKFKKLLEKIPKFPNQKEPSSHNYLYQILTTMEYIDKGVQNLFEEYGLSMAKRILLTNTNLRKHPIIQKSLITEIAGLSWERSRIVVSQKIRDIETKALVKTGKDSYTIDTDKREKIDTKIHVVKDSIMKYLDILDNVNDLIYSLTGHKRLSGESEYTQEHIDFSEAYRIEILKGLSAQQKTTLFKDLTLASDGIDSFIDIIENEQHNKKKNHEEVLKNE